MSVSKVESSTLTPEPLSKSPEVLNWPKPLKVPVLATAPPVRIAGLSTDSLGFFSKGLHRLLGAALMAALCGSGFTAISIFNRNRFGSLPLPIVHRVWLDNAIPFTPSWIWVYLLYYPFCFLPLFLPEVRQRASVFSRTLVGFAIQFLVSFTVFLFFPLRMIHPVLPIGIEAGILKGLYNFDLGFSSFPSLHLANIVYVSCLFWKFHRGRAQAWAVGGVALMIAASTLLIKQHFVSDVLIGALLGWMSFVLAFAIRLAPPLEGKLKSFSNKC